MTNYVLIGNPMAANSAAARIRSLDPGSPIAFITDEPYPFYSRCALIDNEGDQHEADLIARATGAWSIVADNGQDALMIVHDREKVLGASFLGRAMPGGDIERMVAARLGLAELEAISEHGCGVSRRG